MLFMLMYRNRWIAVIHVFTCNLFFHEFFIRQECLYKILNSCKKIKLIWFALICSCQTYEGGFGGYPGLEAHGGYSFCGLAALVILGHGKLCNVEKLLVSYMWFIRSIYWKLKYTGIHRHHTTLHGHSGLIWMGKHKI